MGVDEEKCVRTCASETLLIMLRRIDEAKARILLGTEKTWQSTQRRYHQSLGASPLNKAQPGTFVTIHQLWLGSRERAEEEGKKKRLYLMQGSPSKFEKILVELLSCWETPRSSHFRAIIISFCLIAVLSWWQQ